jgi:hypothetical protein
LTCVAKTGELTIEGVSVLPPEDELAKKQTDSEKVALIEHTLYTKIQELIKKGVDIDTILSKLFEGLQINKDVILSSNLASDGLTSSSNISPYDFFVWVTTAIAYDSYDFMYNYKEVLKKEQYKFMPFFIQEHSSKILYSFAKDKQGIHKKAIEWLYKDAPAHSLEKAYNIFFLNGIAGAGKTTAVMSVVNAMLAPSSIWIAGPNENQASKLGKSLEVFGPLPQKTK